jgi:hypothetical protein
MRQTDQKLRYTDVELSLIKNTFAGDDTYLYAVRKHMLGMELTKGELDIIKNMTAELKALLRKVFLPQIDGDAPLFQLVDMQMGLGADIKGKTKQEANDYIDAKALEIDYIDSRIQKLDGMVATDMPSLGQMANLRDPNAFVNITARNYLLSYIDSFVNELKLLAGRKEDSVEETIKKIRKDSSK